MKNILITFFCFTSLASAGQVTNVDSMGLPENLENIFSVKLTDDSLSTAFMIYVKTNVKLHTHQNHTEQIYILEGEGIMTLGENHFQIKEGDFFIIPKNTAHGLKVTSATPVKLISVQSPNFDGTDRLWLE